MTLESLIIFLLIGAVAGWLAGLIVKGYGFGFIGNIVVGILGAFVAGFLFPVIHVSVGAGIVGAILLAASRAIGETMIVVMGAGAAAKLSLNPFEAMTTVTVKIVGQLTGDTEFASPETLVAFALGLVLFVFTLGLNVIALVVVRKYREQYE